MIVHKSHIRVLYWNARSIVNKIVPLYSYLEDNLVDICCVNETHLKPDIHLPAHPDFMIYRHDRVESTMGGVMIIIRRSIKHSLLPVMKTNIVENIGIEVAINRRKIQFFSCYLPGGSQTNLINQHFANDITEITRRNNSYFAIGDFNASHYNWNCLRNNRAGSILSDNANNGSFFILHPDTHTHFPSNSSHAPSTIDLILTNGFNNISDPYTTPLGSDHAGVTFDVELDEDMIINPPALKPCHAETNWETFQSEIERELHNDRLHLPEVNTTEQVDELIQRFSTVVISAQTNSVPMKLPSRYKICITSEIKDKITMKHNLERQRQRTINYHLREILKMEINTLQQEIEHEINQIRNENWSHKLESLPTDEHNKSLFRITKFLKNRNKSIPPLRSNGTILMTAQEKADALGEQFASAHINRFAEEDPEFTNDVKQKVDQYLSQPSTAEPYYVSHDEIVNVIKKLKNSKAPGNDRIHNSLLKHLPHVGLVYVRFIVACCFKLNYFPKAWKHARVIPINKPGKDARKADSYRPISLLSSLSKVLEKIIATQIMKHVDENNILPAEQGGFRKGHSTTHQLRKIMNHVRTGFQARKSTGMILADIEKAYDKVWHDGLLSKMIDMNFPEHIIRIMNSFMKDRSFQVTILDKSSAIHFIPFGLPQGSCISPFLYNIYTSDQPPLTNCERVLFADDTALFTSSTMRAEITIPLRNALQDQIRYFRKWKISLNVGKTQAAFLSRRRTREIPRRPLRVNNSSIRWTDEPVRYLGVLFDKRMTLQHHIKYVIRKTNMAIRMLYSMLNRRSKLSISNKILMYKIILRPMFCYAAPILNDIAVSNRNKLQVLQNKTLRMCLNKEWNFPTDELHEEAGVESVNDFIARLTTRFESLAG